MQHSVRAYIEQHQLFSRHDRLLVALSGGPDSVALLSVLCELGYDCLAVHVNFHLRGEESDRDEAFVRDFCQRLGVVCRVEHLPAAEYAAARKISVEMAARELRYRRFEEIRREEGLAAIVTGHHRDDNIETFLLNLLRGSGPQGLAAMRPRNGYVVRPLLGVSRAEIMAWLADRKLPYVLDSTNAQADCRRNQIRLDLLPEIEKIEPSARALIARSIDLQRESADFCQQETARALCRLHLDDVAHFTRLAVADLEKEALPESILFAWLSKAGYDARTVETVWQHRHDTAGKQYESPSHRLLLDRAVWLLCRRDEMAHEGQEIWIEEDTARAAFLQLEYLPMPAAIVRRSDTACLDAGKLQFPLCLRPLRRGDSFVPLGMNGRRLVSDYLTDRKKSRWEKQQTWVLLCGEEIVWVVGERISQHYRVTDRTSRMLKITYRPDSDNTES